MAIDHQRVSGSFDEPRSERIGPYRVLDLLGSGGMGEVWLAEQLEPVRRQVAIKLLRKELESREVIARFEAERQVLALMDHPSIARVYDAGMTSDGRPYFAMELVRGVPITEYCDANRLSTRARLDMFASVCRGVQHAHQKGIIHRDLKPSNILVCTTESGPVAKIIDFGIAKAIGGQWLTDKTLHTQFGQILGTPAYMSPEQAQTAGMDVDTRADIYSLGVMLYELLVGALPYEPSPAAPLEFAISAKDVVRPSVRVMTLGAGTTVASFRMTSVAELRKELRGDLDWIVLRAMDKDRSRRYDTANGLALDITRFLRNEPISARPPSTAYRISKLIRRNRAATVAVAVALVAMIVGTLAATVGFVRATRSEATARAEAATAREISAFLTDLMSGADPGNSRGASITAREILDRGSRQLRGRLRGEPRVRARLLGTIGRVYAGLAVYDSAESLLREALSTELMLDSGSAAVWGLRRDLAGIAHLRGHLDSAAAVLTELTSPRQPPLPDSLVASARLSLARVEMARGQRTAADSLLRIVLAEEAEAPGDSLVLASALGSMAFLHDHKPLEYEPMLQRALAIYMKKLGPDHPRTLNTKNSLGLMLIGLGRWPEAAALFQEAGADAARVFGPDHPAASPYLQNAGSTLTDMGAPARALPLLTQAAAMALRGDSAEWAFVRHELGEAHLRLGNVTEARRVLEEALDILERKRGPAHNWTAQTRLRLAETYAAAGRLGDAERQALRALRDQERNFGPVHRRLVEPLTVLGYIHATRARLAAADTMYRRAIAVADSVIVPVHPWHAQIRVAYAGVLRRGGQATRADSILAGIGRSRR